MRRLVVTTCLWGRYELARIVLDYYARQRERRLELSGLGERERVGVWTNVDDHGSGCLFRGGELV